MPFFEYENIRIFNDDFVASHSLPDSSIDLIVTSPPYNVKIDYSRTMRDKLPLVPLVIESRHSGRLRD